jgi:hypothetical protein
MQIIGGIVAYEDGVKTTAGDQFSPTRKVRVELNFSVDQGEDGQVAIQTVLGTAQAFVRTKLGLAPNTEQKPAAGTTTGRAPSEAPATANAPKRGPGRPAADPKPDIKTDKDKLAEAAGVAAPVVGKDAPKPEAKPDPAAIVDEETTAVVEEEDPFAVPAAEEVKPISDDDLNSSVGKKNATLNKPPLIRDLVATFKPEGWTKQFTMRDIPQARRPDFLKKLSELK